MTEFYSDAMRAAQDRYEGREVADKLHERRVHDACTEHDLEIIQSAAFFFLSTAGADNVDCSFKGGAPGFVRVTGPNVLEWPDYDGNRMYRSLGNIVENPRVGMLFINFDGTDREGLPARLRINGRAEVIDDPAAFSDLPGAKRLVRVVADHIFPNCPRYIPTMPEGAPSKFLPQAGQRAPEPAWKSRDYLVDVFAAEKDGKKGP